MTIKHITINLLIGVFLWMSATVALAGESYFGLGNNSFGLVQTPYSAKAWGRSFGMADPDSLQLNFRNYAAWTNIPITTLTLNSSYSLIRAENPTSISLLDNANFQGAALGIPVMKRTLTLGANIQPYSTIEQRVAGQTTVDSNTVEQNVFVHGGLSRANLILAWKPIERMSFSLGYEYTFGLVTEEAFIKLNDNFDNRFNFSYQNRVNGHGLVTGLHATPLDGLSLGVQYRPMVTATLVQTGDTPAKSLNAAIERPVTLPAEYNFGMEYRWGDRYAAGADVIYQDWENAFKIDGQKVNGYAPFYRVSMGLERRGSTRQFIDYGKLIDWRAGWYYTQMAHTFNGQKVMETGLSIGAGLPLQRYRSKIDLYINVSRRGDMDANKLQEWVFRVGLGISANEIWFVNVEE
ncbi:MAG: hypothetical protein D6677_00095 [Calditrichaeota bacterium]|nr:MAG: hypothetical protein D6677_00095 [Calditrichota bacterium]